MNTTPASPREAKVPTRQDQNARLGRVADPAQTVRRRVRATGGALRRLGRLGVVRSEGPSGCLVGEGDVAPELVLGGEGGDVPL